MLDRAVGARRHVDGAAILGVTEAGAVGGILDQAVGAAIDDDIAAALRADCTYRGPIGRSEDGVGFKLDGDRRGGGSVPSNDDELLTRCADKSAAEMNRGAGANLRSTGAPIGGARQPGDGFGGGTTSARTGSRLVGGEVQILSFQR